MTGKTITTTIAHTVTLGSASYASPLTIATTGEIAPATTGAIGIDLPSDAAFDTIVNHGQIFGGTGGYDPENFAGLTGGTAVDLLSSASLNNTGSIIAGSGGSSDTGGYGGIGIDVLASSTIVNSGLISGGAGAYGHYGAGAGGIGIALAFSTTLTNSGTISGGAGGNSYFNPEGNDSAGGIAVSAASEAFITNTGLIVGGLGGTGGSYQQQNGALGGDGLILRNGGTLTNSATIIGGGGGLSVLGSLGGVGGIGVYVAAASVTNTGTITGGYGGLVAAERYYSTGGAGGAGLAATNYAAVTNSGHITGGGGGPVEAGGAGGTGVTISGYATLANTGHITGGAGGYGGVNLDLLAGDGGAGVAISSGTFVNHGTVLAGAGGYGNATPATYGPSRQNGGDGGVGILATSGTQNGVSLANYGAVTGGAGGSLTAYSTYASYGTAGNGGVGVLIVDVSFANHGTITGGAGGISGPAVGLTGTAGIGGLGAFVGLGASLTNSGTITGGTGGTSVEVGVAGGDGVLIVGGTVSDTGMIRGGAGGVSTDDGPRGDAVYFAGSIAGTLILNPGAALGGSVASAEGVANVVELAGTSTTTLGGFGTEFIDIPILSFANGAQRIAEGSIAGFSTIDGFAPHDVIVLDGYTALLRETEINADSFVLFNSLGGTTLDIFHPGAQDFIITDGGGKTTLTPVLYTYAHTLGSNAAQFVLSNGTATATTIDSGGYEQIHGGGTAAATTIAGGTLELEIGAKVTGGISFSAAKGGKLTIDSVTMPAATISGFISGDTIALAGVAYNKTDTVAVAKAGVVTITAPGKAYNLNIAGATVGETDFHFGTGSILTRSAAPAKMQFLTPAAAATASSLPALDTIKTAEQGQADTSRAGAMSFTLASSGGTIPLLSSPEHSLSFIPSEKSWFAHLG